jgi:hypothetical protein
LTEAISGFPVDIPTLAIVVSSIVLVLQTIILWRQTQILSRQTSFGETVDLSVQLVKSTIHPQTLLVNVKNEGKGVAHTPSFDYLLEGNSMVFAKGTQELQTLGPGSIQNLMFNTTPTVSPNAVLHLEWQGKRDDGSVFTGSRQISVSSATLTQRQFNVE